MVGRVNLVPAFFHEVSTCIDTCLDRIRGHPTVGKSRLDKQEICLHVDSPVLGRHLEIRPAEVLLRVEVASLLDEHGELQVADFLLVQPSGGQRRRVDEEEAAANTDHDGN